jgi:peptide/nickel transport system substrate-binding protein
VEEPTNYWSKLSQKRLTRRRALKGGLLLGGGLAAAAVVGCGDEGEPSATTPGGTPAAQEPKRGGILNRTGRVWTDGTGLDPSINNSAAFARSFRIFYQGLLGYDFRTYAVEPEIAMSWEQPSPNEYIFTIQPGVKWHNKLPANGRALTVEDVVFSLERARTDDPRFQSRSYLESVDKIQATSPNTLKLTSRWVDASFLTKLTVDDVMVLNPQVVEAAGNFATADTGVGTGPFIITEYEKNLRAKFIRNPDYWKQGQPYLDEVRGSYVADELVEWAAFLGGELDIAIVPDQELKAYVARQGANFSPDWFYQDTCTQSVPQTQNPPMNDRRVVRALRLLHDHEEFVQAIAFGYGRNGTMPAAFAPSGWDFSHDEYYKFLEWKQPKTEAAQTAIQLLSAAGYNKDKPLRFEYAGRQNSQAGQLLHDQLRRLSQGVVETEYREYDRPTQGRKWTDGSFQYMEIGLSAGIVDVDAFLSLIFHTDGSRNFARFSDSRLDSMIIRQREIIKEEERRAYVKEILTYMMDVAPYTIPYNPVTLNATNLRLRNYAPETHIQGRQYERLWFDT